MNGLKIKIRKESAIVAKLKELAIVKNEEKEFLNRVEKQKLVFEFFKDPSAENIDMNLAFDFDSDCSPIWATIKLGALANDLRYGDSISEPRRIQLADALDRVWKDRKAKQFLYGENNVGGQPMDTIRNFWLFMLIEIQYAKLGRYDSSREQGAYAAVADHLRETNGPDIEIDELKRVRRNVLNKVNKDIQSWQNLVNFLAMSGYKMIGTK